MGKRKRNSQHNNLDLPPSSEGMLCSSGIELLSKEHSPNLDAGINVGDSSAKLLNSNSSVAQQHHNLGRSVFLKQSHHYHGCHYSYGNCGSLAYPSTSRGKISPSHDERSSFTFTRYNPEFGCLADGREKAFGRAERIKSSLLVMDALSPSKVKMICGICQKHLRWKPYFLGNKLASGEYSVVAVLVCGLVCHADCLEERTSVEDRRDPPCPLCSGSPPQV